ncbi:hypothetical protein B0H13DRAFT_2285211 [Mycena leptocephala]|nr:hypothetical protein B0H13DRAFT_2285211 [Mycena leptocephala]
MNLDPVGGSIEKRDDEATVSNLSSTDLSEPGVCCGFEALLLNLRRARQTERSSHLSLRSFDHSQSGQTPSPSTSPDLFRSSPTQVLPPNEPGNPSFTNVPHTPNGSQHSLAGLTSATAKTWSASASTLVKQSWGTGPFIKLATSVCHEITGRSPLATLRSLAPACAAVRHLNKRHSGRALCAPPPGQDDCADCTIAHRLWSLRMLRRACGKRGQWAQIMFRYNNERRRCAGTAGSAAEGSRYEACGKPQGARSPQTTLRPAGAGDASNTLDIVLSSSREAARQVEAAMAPADADQVGEYGEAPAADSHNQHRFRFRRGGPELGGEKAPDTVAVAAAGRRAGAEGHAVVASTGDSGWDGEGGGCAALAGRGGKGGEAEYDDAPATGGRVFKAHQEEPLPAAAAHDARVPLGTAAIATAYRRSNKLTKARQSGEMLPIPRASTETPPQTHRHVASKSGETLTPNDNSEAGAGEYCSGIKALVRREKM